MNLIYLSSQEHQKLKRQCIANIESGQYFTILTLYNFLAQCIDENDNLKHTKIVEFMEYEGYEKKEIQRALHRSSYNKQWAKSEKDNRKSHSSHIVNTMVIDNVEKVVYCYKDNADAPLIIPFATINRVTVYKTRLTLYYKLSSKVIYPVEEYELKHVVREFIDNKIPINV